MRVIGFVAFVAAIVLIVLWIYMKVQDAHMRHK